MHDFTHLTTCLDIVHLLIHHAGFHMNHSPSTGAGFAQLVLGSQQGRQGRDFRLPVKVP